MNTASVHVPSYNKCFEKAVKTYWDKPFLSDYQTENFTYQQSAAIIERLHAAFRQMGIEKGDRIAICGRNSSRWGLTFWAVITYGAVAVPILHEFHPDQVADIVEHSEAKMLFVGPFVWPKLNPDAFTKVPAVVSLKDFSVIMSACGLVELPEVEAPTRDSINYYEDTAEEMAVLNYTSGTTSNSKGVMIPYRALWSNYDFAITVLGHKVQHGSEVLSMLPMAHMYGMAFEFLFESLHGCHITFLNKNASPSVLLKALKDVKPRLIILVPLILEKVVRTAVMPKLQTPLMKVLWNTPLLNRVIKNKVRAKLDEAFGGNFCVVIAGGAALASDVESLLRDIKFHFTVGYGATECAPILSYEAWEKFVPQSCGKAAKHMELKINSSDPQHVSGEILARGLNTLLGYYKNPEATEAVLDKEGWYHTGDMGVIDAEGNLFIKGRCKNMLLGANGQNIYPEEIEDKLTAQFGVAETVVIQNQKDQKLYALIFPNFDALKAKGVTDLEAHFENVRVEVNKQIPRYCQIVGVRLRNEEFEKTPKKSIKRFLYLNTEV